MSIAPNPQLPEKPGNTYDRKITPAMPGQRGPLRFEEGLGTDTDVPQEFAKGALQGYVPAAGRPNRNQAVHTKTADETMRERAHVGSASWVEAPDFLSEFSGGSFQDYATNQYEEKFVSGSHQQRPNPAQVND